MLDMFKGWRTLAFGLALAVAPAALQYLGGVDWASYIGPNAAFFVAGIVTLLLRAVTTTPIGTK